MDDLTIKILLEDDAKMPTKAHKEDAGFDLYCPHEVVVGPRGCAVVDTGVHMMIPFGYVGFLKSKSGLNVKNGIRTEGVIDSYYTGSIVVKIYNDSYTGKVFYPGEKITQIVILPIPDVQLELVEKLPETDRGSNGFGSSGDF